MVFLKIKVNACILIHPIGYYKFFGESFKNTLTFGMTRGAKMSLALHEPIWNVLCSNLHTTSMHAPKIYQTWKVL
jgi:hypothetical protein